MKSHTNKPDVIMLADLDELLSDTQRLDLETHLTGCEACQAESESLSTLTSRLQSEFHNRWDAHDGPSQNVLVNVHSQTRRIVMTNRINFGLRAVAGVVVLLILGFGLNALFSQLRDHSIAVNDAAASDNTMPVSTRSEDRLLAFTKVEDGNSDVYTIHANGSGLTNLTNNPAQDANPIWSRDGKRIVFESDRTGITQIYMMNADGSNMMQLTNDNTEHSLLPTDDIRFNVWSPDDSNLLFTQKEVDGITNDLYSLDINNGNRILLASDTRSIGNASWSPNGEYVGYVSSEEIEPGAFIPHLYIVDATGNNIQELSSYLSKNEQVFTPYFWASDGRSIIFPAIGIGSEENRVTIHQLDPQENTFRTLMTTIPMLYEWYGEVALGIDGNQRLVWQRPDGTSAKLDLHEHAKPENCFIGKARSLQGNLVIGSYCSKKDDNLSLYWTNMDGSQIQPLPEVKVPEVNGAFTSLTLSPDEKFITLNFKGENETNLFYIWDVKDTLENPTSKPIEIPIGNVGWQYFIPSWQPIPTDGITEEQTTQTPTDNGLLAFTKVENGNADIYTIHADGSELTNLTNNPAYDGNPFWSPDGRRIAFESNRTGFMQIFLMNADGSNVIQLTDDEADHRFESSSPWSPDGSKLTFTERAPGDEKWMLYVIDADGQNKTVLTPTPNLYSAVSWAPNGSHIAFVIVEPVGDRDMARIHVINSKGDNDTNITSILPEDEDIDWNYTWTREGNIRFVANRVYAENYNTKFAVYEAAIDGATLVEIAKTSTPLADWWEGTSFVRGFTGETLTWLRADGTYSEFKPYENCQMGSDFQGSSFSRRSSTGYLLYGAGCPNGDLWLYWANPDGTNVKQLLESPIQTTDGGLDGINWSPDNGHVSLTLNSSGITYLYILDVREALKNPITPPEPISIGGGDIYYNVSWQPIP